MKISRIVYILMLATLGLGACKEGAVREVLDEETLVSIITISPPFTFYRLRLENKIEREFVSLGPVDRIRSAERGQYLWVNTWAVERDGTHVLVPLPQSITIETTNGEFSLTRAADDHHALDFSKPAYRVVSSGAGEAYFDLPFERLEDLRDTSIVAVRAGSQRYELWGDQAAASDALARFIVETTGY